VKQAGRGGKLKSRRQQEMKMEVGVVARAGKSEGARESPDKSLC